MKWKSQFLMQFGIQTHTIQTFLCTPEERMSTYESLVYKLLPISPLWLEQKGREPLAMLSNC